VFCREESIVGGKLSVEKVTLIGEIKEAAISRAFVFKEQN
jgi:hypothetical protein